MSTLFPPTLSGPHPCRTRDGKDQSMQITGIELAEAE